MTDLDVRPQIAQADKVARVDLGFDELVDLDGAVPVELRLYRRPLAREEETQHFPCRVGPSRVGVGAGETAA